MIEILVAQYRYVDGATTLIVILFKGTMSRYKA